MREHERREEERGNKRIQGKYSQHVPPIIVPTAILSRVLSPKFRQISSPGYATSRSPVQHLEDQRHRDEEVGLVAREVLLERLHAAVHEPGAVAEEEVLARALVDVPGRQQAQHDVTGLGPHENLQVLDLRAGGQMMWSGAAQKSMKWNEM